MPLIENYGNPKVLHRELSKNPNFFADVISLVYKGDDEERHEVSQDDSARARVGDDLIRSWRQGPGCGEDGTVDVGELRTWVQQARQQLKSRRRQAIGEYAIGSALLNVAHNPDGSWPHEVVCDLIEEIESPELENGLETSCYNSRGVYTKSLTAGGVQERNLAERYQEYANQLRNRRPRTAAMLERIAQRYNREARREDINSELTQDLWR